MITIQHKLTRSRRFGFKSHRSRDGLSVIEVLTSIIVALIGVFGVMAMIPFSVKQTQSGLDKDAATSMARNALSNFETAGYKVVSGVPGTSTKQLNWIDSTGSNVTTTVNAGTSLLCIDPLGITENGAFTTFPFNSASPLTIPTATLALPGVNGAGNPIPFTIADARRMFRLTDDLVFEQSDDPSVVDSDLNGPVQIFNEDGTGALNRQSNGTVSWCAIAHPQITNRRATEVDSYKFYVLVFKDRVTDTTTLESAMLSAKVLSPTEFAQAATVTIEGVLPEDVRRDDWVMLINQEAGTAPIAQRTNISFARIANLYSDEVNSISQLSLDGPDFLFTPDTPDATATYIVHLKDVVAVFPRTIKLETDSGWTVSAD